MRNFGSIISQWSNFDGDRETQKSNRSKSNHSIYSRKSTENRFTKNLNQISNNSSRRGTANRKTVRSRLTEHKSYYKKGTFKKKKSFKIGPANIDNLDDENSDEDEIIRKISGSFDEDG